MLNRAARFLPILSELKQKVSAGETLLEVGSGSLGLGEFWHGPFVGCDVNFKSAPVRNMRAVRCSGHQLPFEDQSFDAAVVSDVIEHVPPPLREEVVGEVLRVTRKVAVFGYPCGPEAFALDQQLYHSYLTKGSQPPQWLEEHMQHPFPDDKIFLGLPDYWRKRVLPNESLRFHDWMMKTEMFLPWDYSFRVALRMMPRLMEQWLQKANQEPSYRKIFVLTREPQPRHV